MTSELPTLPYPNIHVVILTEKPQKILPKISTLIAKYTCTPNNKVDFYQLLKLPLEF
ncbi:MAG: hypothetical protein LUD00_10860 [Prevotellaceae bacterium]|nr:hypothetical protein [Prevotellaceae bacterium]